MLRATNYTDTVLRYLDLERKRAQRTHDEITTARLTKIHEELASFRKKGLPVAEKKVVEIDHDKTVLLAHTFGPKYTQALALATGNGIRAEVYVEETELTSDELHEIARKYFLENRGKTPIFIRVLKDPAVIENTEVKEPNVYLQIRKLLAKVGLTFNLESFSVEKAQDKEPFPESVEKNEPYHGPEVTVNVYNWFCTCEQFTHDIARYHNATSEDILSQLSGVDNAILARWFSQSDCNHISPLPICMHLLAVVLAVHNFETAGISTHQIRDFSEI